MCRGRYPPDSRQEPRNHDVLVQFGQRAPPASVTGATHEQVTSSPSNGIPIVSNQLCCSFRRVPGSRASQAARSGLLAQANASRAGMVTTIVAFCGVRLVVVHSG